MGEKYKTKYGGFENDHFFCNLAVYFLQAAGLYENPTSSCSEKRVMLMEKTKNIYKGTTPNLLCILYIGTYVIHHIALLNLKMGPKSTTRVYLQFILV